MLNLWLSYAYTLMLNDNQDQIENVKNPKSLLDQSWSSSYIEVYYIPIAT